MKYKPFTLKAALELASPHTWVASVGPCCIAGALAVCCALLFAFLQPGEELGVLPQMAVVLDGRSALCWVLMLACAVLMQSAANTLNDYQDFKSGLDTAETILDETDASIVYNQIDPRDALVFSLALLTAAGVAGVTVALLSSLWLIAWGALAAAGIALYSVGPKPISSLPLGEAVSGIAMGGILTGTAFFATTLAFSSAVMALSVVSTVSIAQIMQTNNTCDIDRDTVAGRKTMPMYIGRYRSGILNASASVFTFLWLGAVLMWMGLYPGVVVALAGLLLSLPKINALLRGPYDLANRRVMMGTVVSYNKRLFATAVIALVLGGILSVWI